MYADLKGKTALVTGAGKETGIGYAIGRKLAASGMNVILADLGREGADERTGQNRDQGRTGRTGPENNGRLRGGGLGRWKWM